MFTLNRRANPLDLFAAHAGSNLVENRMQDQELAHRNAEIKKGFEKLGENPSRIDILQTIEGLRIPDEQKERLYKGFGDIEKDKLLREKAKEEAAKGEKKDIRAQKLAQTYGITQQEAEGLEPTDIATLGRHRNKPPPGGLTGQPVPSEQGAKIKQVLEANRGANADDLASAFDEAGIPPTYSNKYVENRRREDENKIKQEELGLKKVEAADKVNKDFIDTTTQGYRAWEFETKPRLQQMQALNQEGKLAAPIAAKVLEALHIPLGALENPDSEVYDKLSHDLLKGLPETYGNRILKVEVDNFLRTIPTLMNSPNGRLLITSNMMKLGQMKEVYYNEMRDLQKSYIDKEKALPRDFEQRVLDNSKPQLEQLTHDFLQLPNLQFLEEGQIPYFNEQGILIGVPPEAEEFVKAHGGRRVW